jgi:hypothetical protein
MMSPTNRFTAVLYTVIGLGIVAIMYFGGGDNRLADTLRILLATIAAVLLGIGLVRRDIPLLVVTAGLAAWSVDTFNPQQISRHVLPYIGTVLFLGGIFLMSRKSRTAPQTGV